MLPNFEHHAESTNAHADWASDRKSTALDTTWVTIEATPTT